MQVIKVGMDKKNTLASLMQQYLHDLSLYTGEVPDSQGQYSNGKYFDLYWSDGHRHPYILEVKEGEVLGFALVRQLDEDTNSIAEFYIQPECRRLGLGRWFAASIFRRHPGRWVVAELESNAPAIAFWRRVVSDTTKGKFSETWSDEQPRGPKQEFYISAQPGTAPDAFGAGES